MGIFSELFLIMKTIFLTVFYCIVVISTAQETNEIVNDVRPYEFAFNVVDFQHRFEKKGK